MALTDTAIRNAKPKEKPYKVTDSLGLYLLVNPRGRKLSATPVSHFSACRWSRRSSIEQLLTAALGRLEVSEMSGKQRCYS